VTIDTPEVVLLHTLHTVKLPAILGGLDVTSRVRVYLDDQALFTEIASRYGAEVTHFDAGEDVPAFDHMTIDVDTQRVEVYYRENATWASPSVNVDVCHTGDAS
jgi:hypothetical protein